MTKLKGLKQHEKDAAENLEKQKNKNSDYRSQLAAEDWKIVRAMEQVLTSLEDPSKAFTKKELGDVIDLIKKRRDLRAQVIE